VKLFNAIQHNLLLSTDLNNVILMMMMILCTSSYWSTTNIFYWIVLQWYHVIKIFFSCSQMFSWCWLDIISSSYKNLAAVVSVHEILVVVEYRKADGSWQSWRLDVVLGILYFRCLVKQTMSSSMHVIFHHVLSSL